jgi:hypothetical protein
LTGQRPFAREDELASMWALGDDPFEREWQTGQRDSVEEAVRVALER